MIQSDTWFRWFDTKAVKYQKITIRNRIIKMLFWAFTIPGDTWQYQQYLDKNLLQSVIFVWSEKFHSFLRWKTEKLSLIFFQTLPKTIINGLYKYCLKCCCSEFQENLNFSSSLNLGEIPYTDETTHKMYNIRK